MSEHPATSRLVPGAQIGRYKIEASLGVGGMGEVFRARDLRLGRIVAIKILRPEFDSSIDFHDRFEREARAISALNHSHICSLHDVGEQGDFTYLVMEYVEGETLARMLERGALPVNLAVRYGAEIADALQAAHAHGIVHRDLKPANIVITDAGVKVLDFGLAKQSYVGAPEEMTATVPVGQTRAGQIVGTAAYMSPEQAEGRTVGASSDMFSLGVVLYEMLCGRRPFRGETTLSTVAAVLRDIPEPPRKIRHEIPELLERIVLRCLEKSPAARYASVADVHRELEQYQVGRGARIVNVGRRRWMAVAAALLILVAAGAIAARTYMRTSRMRWAEKEVLEVVRLMEKKPLAAMRLLRQVEQVIPSSPELRRVKDALYVGPGSVETMPPGADVYIRDYSDTADDPASWEHLGRSPVKTDRVPRGYYRIRLVKDGFDTLELASAGPATPGGLRFRLHDHQTTPQGMVWVPDFRRGALGTGVFQAMATVGAPEFWLDRHEVTNREFKEFVDRGGYRNQAYWKEPFTKDDKVLSWDQAMVEFRDATGRPGPATWELGTFPEGKGDYPVGGVSWYEAAAYAEFAHKNLPTVFHWLRAASVGAFSDVLELSNFAGQGPARVESYRGLGPFGTYDMAGNVKEWVWNPSGDRRYILGGGWNEPNYQFMRPDARKPLDREATFGFRCVKYESAIPSALAGQVPFTDRDRRNDKPVDERAYEIYRSLHAYDKTDLKAAVESVDETSPYWRREKVSFQAAYGNERMTAYLYLPRNAAPPYQAAAYFPGSSALGARTIEDLREPVEFIIRSGRALILPVYKGTLERGPGAYYHYLGEPNRWREMNLQWSKDLGRSLDYLETRPDIDTGKLVYYGFSLGAAMGPRLVAMEPRFKTALLLSGGSFEKVPPEVDAWNFAPRVRIPVLMLNGRDDFLFPLESSQVPLFRALGTSDKDKRHVLFEGGHVNYTARLDLVKVALDWLDRYLGSVKGLT